MSAPKASFSVGERVRIKSGAFAAFKGRVEEVDNKRLMIKIGIEIFGRLTTVEVEESQVEITDATDDWFTSLNWD